MLLLRRLTLAVACLGLPASPLLALYCRTEGRAAMACCKSDPQACNRGEKPGGCCRSLPHDGSQSATVIEAARGGVPPHAVGPIPAVNFGTAGSALDECGRLSFATGRVPLGLPPPLLAPLRI